MVEEVREMWARPRAKIRGVWRVLAGLKARCSGVSGLTFAIRGQSSTKPGPINFRGCGERGSMFLLDLYNNKNIRRESDRSQAAELNTFTRVGTAHLLSCSIVRESTATRLPPSPSVRYAARRVETLHVLCVLSDCASALHVHADLCGGWQREKRM